MIMMDRMKAEDGKTAYSMRIYQSRNQEISLELDDIHVVQHQPMSCCHFLNMTTVDILFHPLDDTSMNVDQGGRTMLESRK
jgi:hypothetical protein